MPYQKIRGYARHNRKNPTPAEQFFWEQVRNRRLAKQKFYRQYIITYHQDSQHRQYYIADFYCHRHRVVIELDGGIHLHQREPDSIRDSRMSEMGIRVLRFSNDK